MKTVFGIVLALLLISSAAQSEPSSAPRQGIVVGNRMSMPKPTYDALLQRSIVISTRTKFEMTINDKPVDGWFEAEKILEKAIEETGSRRMIWLPTKAEKEVDKLLRSKLIPFCQKHNFDLFVHVPLSIIGRDSLHEPTAFVYWEVMSDSSPE